MGHENSNNSEVYIVSRERKAEHKDLALKGSRRPPFFLFSGTQLRFNGLSIRKEDLATNNVLSTAILLHFQKAAVVCPQSQISLEFGSSFPPFFHSFINIEKDVNLFYPFHNLSCCKSLNTTKKTIHLITACIMICVIEMSGHESSVLYWSVRTKLNFYCNATGARGNSSCILKSMSAQREI